MPLPKAAPRNILHQREIFLRGYARVDGLVDIEAHLTDIKSYTSFTFDRGHVPAGEPIHDMWLRLTISRNMMIVDCVAAMDGTPHHPCSDAAPNYAALVGLRIGKGFLKAASERIGARSGCTHLREMLQQIGTTAFQTMMSVDGNDQQEEQLKGSTSIDAMVNTCHAFDEDGPVVARFRRMAAASGSATSG